MPLNLTKYMNIRKLSLLGFINALVVLVLLLLLELGFRLIYQAHNDPLSFRLTQPAPYQNATYFSEEFIVESFKQPGGWVSPPGTNLLLPNDFKGKYFTVENGVRRTTDTPRSATRNIYLFGGSTVYSSEVPDNYTIASYLQRKLVENGFNDYRVINLGVTSAATIQQLERLKITKLTKNDLVIFYDGVNDVVQGVLYGKAGGTIVGSDKARPIWQRLLAKMNNHSVAARYLLKNLADNYKINNLDARVKGTVYHYRNNIDAAEKITSKQGASFLHFLQPTLSSLSPQNVNENYLLNIGIVLPQADGAFRATYPHLEELIRDRARRGFFEFSLTTAFDNLNSAVYLDFAHINHVGNERVAKSIFTSLLKTGSLRPHNSSIRAPQL